jgi:3-hydroxyisobutyrate dehydrogenase
MAHIAFLGLGRMGHGMAGRLIDAGHRVVVWNRSTAKAEDLIARGATLASTPAKAVDGADAIFTMLADDTAARAVWDGPDGILTRARAGAFAIECSTLSRHVVMSLSEKAAAQGLRFIDCPVTGLPSAAAAGQLTLLVGADPDDLAAARPMLDTLATTIRYFGPAGQGTAYKLMINLMGSVQIAALAEGLVMAERAGLDLDAVVAAIEDSASASRQVVKHARRMAENHFDDLTFTARLRHKDAACGVALANELGLALPLGQAAVDWFAAAKAGHGDADEGHVIDAVRAGSRR